MEELLKNCEDTDYSFNYILFNPDDETYNNFINNIDKNATDIPNIKYNNIESVYIYGKFPIFASKSTILILDNIGTIDNINKTAKYYEFDIWSIIISKDYIRFQLRQNIDKSLIKNFLNVSLESVHKLLVNKVSLSTIYYQELLNLTNIIYGSIDNFFKYNKLELKNILNNAKVFDKIKYISDIFPLGGTFINQNISIRDKDSSFSFIEGFNGINDNYYQNNGNIGYVEHSGYFVQPKIKGGTRCILVADKYGSRLITYNGIEDCTSIVKSKKLYIIEGDLIDKILYIHDVLYVDGVNMMDLKFRDRVLKITRSVNKLNDIVCPKKLKLYEQNIVEIGNSTMRRQLTQVYNKDYMFVVDGLIMKESFGNYMNGNNYKWIGQFNDNYQKYYNSIDFLVMKTPEELSNDPDYNSDYLLFNLMSEEYFIKFGKVDLPYYKKIFGSNVKKSTMFPVHFAPADNPKAYLFNHSGPFEYQSKTLQSLDKTVCKLIWKIDNNNDFIGGHWQFIEVKDIITSINKFDLASINTYMDALDNWSLYKDPILFKDLYNPQINVNYMFNNYYKFMNYKKYIDDKLLKDYISFNIVDISSGPTIQRNNLENYYKILSSKNTSADKSVIFLNNLSQNLSEIARSKLEFAKKYLKKSATDLDISLLDLDLLEGYENALFLFNENFGYSKISLVNPVDSSSIKTDYNIDSIVLYDNINNFMQSADSLDSLIKFCRNVLNEDGVVIINCMNGNKIFKLIGKESNWSSDDTNKKYEIIKKYKSDFITDYNQLVKIKIPGTDLNYSEEYLVNINTLISEFNKRSFGLIKRNSYAKHYQEYLNEISDNTQKIENNSDKLYLSLYEYLIFKKN